MTPCSDYNDAAYMLAIAEQLERDVIEKYVDGDAQAQETLICEYVVYADREIPQAAFHKFLALLRKIGQQARARVEQYELRRADELPINVVPDDKENGPDEPAADFQAERGDSVRNQPTRRRARGTSPHPRGGG